MYHLLVNCSRWSWFLPAQLHFDVVYKFLAILSLYLRPVQSSAISLSSFVKFATDAIITIFRASILMLQILKSLWCCCIWSTCDLRKDNSFWLATVSFFFCYICYFYSSYCCCLRAISSLKIKSLHQVFATTLLMQDVSFFLPDRWLVGSVGWVSDKLSEGRAFKSWPNQYLVSLNNWGESAVFLISSANV